MANGTLFRLILLVIFLPGAGGAISSNIDCSGTPTPLSNSTPMTTSGPACFQLAMPANIGFVRFEVEPADSSVDLFVAEGEPTSLFDLDRLNVRPIDKPGKYVLLEPQSGVHTVAVLPTSSEGRYTISATLPDLSAGSGGITRCVDGICSTSLPMTRLAQAISLGDKFGDRVIFPITVSSPGKLKVSISWTGNANTLALILNGPDRPELSNPVAAYSRQDGNSPLTLEYNVTSADLKGGKRFRISVVNFSGGFATGNLTIERPSQMFSAFTKLRVNKLNLLRQPVEIKPVTQTGMCRSAVQGKIAFDYAGSTKWPKNLLNSLCSEALNGRQAAECVNVVMHKGVSWGGGRKWNVKNAISLCRKSANANATVACFKRGIHKGLNWQDATTLCQP